MLGAKTNKVLSIPPWFLMPKDAQNKEGLFFITMNEG
jgi:hypothetical protein